MNRIATALAALVMASSASAQNVPAPQTPAEVPKTIDMTQVLKDSDGHVIKDYSTQVQPGEPLADLTLGRVWSVASCADTQADAREPAIDKYRRCRDGEAMSHEANATPTQAQVKLVEDHLSGSSFIWSTIVTRAVIPLIDPNADKPEVKK
jgi:hypothetical protein